MLPCRLNASMSEAFGDDAWLQSFEHVIICLQDSEKMHAATIRVLGLIACGLSISMSDFDHLLVLNGKHYHMNSRV